MKITILEPAMCCTTGVCSEDVDDTLVQTSANVKWLKALGHEVNRYKISEDVEGFLNNPLLLAKLQEEGLGSLPYILVNDQIVMKGVYPEKNQWEKWMDPTKVNNDSACCSGTGCC